MLRLRAIAPLLAAAALTTVAVVTVSDAGCDDPGHYEFRSGGYELVGGCLSPTDLVVPEPAPASPAEASPRIDVTVPARD